MVPDRSSRLEAASSSSEQKEEDKSHKKSKPSTSTTIVKPSKYSVADKPKPKEAVARKPTTSATTYASPWKTRAAGKCPIEAEKEKDRKMKKKKKKSVGDEEDENGSQPEGGHDHKKKKPFERIWSKDDEIIVLKGMSDRKKKGIHPTSNLHEFHDSIQKSIHVIVSKKQLREKIKKLEKKYWRGKDGEGLSFSKHHDIKCYELAKEIWGGQEIVIERERKSTKAGNDDLKNGNGKRSRMEPTTNLSSYPLLNDWLKSNKNLTNLKESIYRDGLSKISDSMAMQYEQRLKDIQIRQLKIDTDFSALQLEQNSLALNLTYPFVERP